MVIVIKKEASQLLFYVDGWNRTSTSVLNADYIIERVKHQVHPRL
ncbi:MULTISPECIES: hypothetical protein [Enterococcus]|nr:MULTISPECIES: hypothetical protein [Enterococcus]